VFGNLLWIDETGQVRASQGFEPVSGYPADQWRAGDIWRGVHILHVPGRLESGIYTVRLRLFGHMGQRLGDGADIGTMTVGAPARTFDLPAPQHESGVEWANGIRLLGYDLPTAPLTPGPATVTLYWQPQQELTEDLTLFVHLIDSDGNIVAQRDQVPRGGARPTLGWASGEVISDSLVIDIPADLPPGDYRLRVGWYDPATGARAPVTAGGDFAILPESLEIGP
jgi:hypothetical protein